MTLSYHSLVVPILPAKILTFNLGHTRINRHIVRDDCVVMLLFLSKLFKIVLFGYFFLGQTKFFIVSHKSHKRARLVPPLVLRCATDADEFPIFDQTLMGGSAIRGLILRPPRRPLLIACHWSGALRCKIAPTICWRSGRNSDKIEGLSIPLRDNEFPNGHLPPAWPSTQPIVHEFVASSYWMLR